MKKFLTTSLIAAILSLTFPSISFGMTLPQTLHVDGLTFSQGLIVESTNKNPAVTQVHFGNIEKIIVKQHKQSHVLAEKVISPAPVKKKSVPKSLIPIAEAAEKEVVVTPTSLPTQTPTPTLQPATITSNAGGLDAEKLFSMINTHRASIGLASFQKDANLCSLAQSRAPELPGEIMNGTIHAGFRNRNLPYWATENMIHQDTEQQAFNWWMNSSLHRSAIEGSHTYACGACQGKSCAMIFTIFQPK